ncbi:hypothetical protein O181_108322, partial [Austropuccinia psidii MF-1]|nr:hypothetical protein [Austropuccinia psidii MF-1]
VTFPDFNTAPSPQTGSNGGLSHLLNVALGEFPTEEIHLKQEQAALNLSKSSNLSIPSSFQSAMKHPPNDKWKRACFVELEQLRKRHVYDLVDLSDEMKVIGHQWVFDLKQDADGTVTKFKARFCAQGDSQRPGIDCGETYAPTASLLCLHLLLSVAKFCKWNLASFDVSGAYFYSPEGRRYFVIWIHVDDGVVASNSALMLESFQIAIQSQLEVELFPTIHKIVGLHCSIDNNKIRLSQPSLIQGILKSYNRPIVKHESTMSTIYFVNQSQPTDSCMDSTSFQYFIGSLSYLVSGTRPDLAFAINKLARHSANPCLKHWLALDHLVGYLLQTQDFHLSLKPSSLDLDLWMDAGWGGSLERSHSGCLMKLGNCPIFWFSKKQTAVAFSTCAAEYIALSDATQHLVQVINHLTHFVSPFKKQILCENEAAIGISANALSRKRM